jgi:hypothetical protein
MRGISRIALLGALVCVLAVGGSALAAAKSHAQRHAHAKVADVIKDVKDAKKDSADAAKDRAAARNDATTPDSPAEAQQEQADAQKEQTDNQSETQDGVQEGDSSAQATTCAGLLTDNVQYDDQTGTCSAETGQDNGADGQNGQDSTPVTGGHDNGTATGGQRNDQNG